MRSVLLIMGFIFVSCSTTLAPKEDRKINFDEKTTKTKDEAYTASLAYLAKNFNNSHQVIKVKDKDIGMIVLRANVTCNLLRQSLDPNDYSLQFNLTIRAKEKSYSMVFEDLTMIDPTARAVKWDYNQMANKENVQKIKPCLDELKNGLLQEVNNT